MCQLNVLTEALPLQNILKLVRRRFEKIWTSLRRNCENVCIKRGTSVIHFSLFYCWCYSRCFSLSFSVLRPRNFPVSFCRLCSQRQKRRSRREKSQQKRPKVIFMSLIHICILLFSGQQIFESRKQERIWREHRNVRNFKEYWTYIQTPKKQECWNHGKPLGSTEHKDYNTIRMKQILLKNLW